MPSCASDLQKQRQLSLDAIAFAKKGRCSDYQDYLAKIDSQAMWDATIWFVNTEISNCVTFDEVMNILYHRNELGEINSQMVESLLSLIYRLRNSLSQDQKARSLLFLQDLMSIEYHIMYEELTGKAKILMAKISREMEQNVDVSVNLINDIWQRGGFDTSSWNQFLSNNVDIIKEFSHFQSVQKMILKGYLDIARLAINDFKNPILTDKIQKALLFSSITENKDIMKIIRNSGYDHFLSLSAIKFAKNLTVENKFEILNKIDNSEASICSNCWYSLAVENVRSMLDKNNVKKSSLHNIILGVKGLHGEKKADQLLFAGWLALDFDNVPRIAIKLFQEAIMISKLADVKSRAYYWLGNAFTKVGDRVSAIRSYQESASHPFVLYGQMSAEELGIKPELLIMNRFARISKNAAQCNVEDTDIMVELAGLIYKNGNKWLALQYSESALKMNHFKCEDNCYLHNILSAMGYEFNIYLSKFATKLNVSITDLAFPTIEYSKSSIVNAVVREESLFRNGMCSQKGAKGMMQLTNNVAKEMASDLNIDFDTNRVLTDEIYNISIGSNFLSKLSSKYETIAIAIVAYNAGTGRVSNWLYRFGNPGVDKYKIITWIESIPYPETRSYVIGVLEAKTVYDAINYGNS